MTDFFTSRYKTQNVKNDGKINQIILLGVFDQTSFSYVFFVLKTSMTFDFNFVT